ASIGVETDFCGFDRPNHWSYQNRRKIMSHQSPLSQWMETVSTMLPKLSRPQAKVLAYWSFGMVLAKSCGITLVCAALLAASGEFGAKPAATLARMVLLVQRQKRAEAARTGCEHVF